MCKWNWRHTWWWRHLVHEVSHRVVKVWFLHNLSWKASCVWAVDMFSVWVPCGDRYRNWTCSVLVHCAPPAELPACTGQTQSYSQGADSLLHSWAGPPSGSRLTCSTERQRGEWDTSILRLMLSRRGVQHKHMTSIHLNTKTLEKMILYTCKCNYLLRSRCDFCYWPVLRTTLVLDQLLSSRV